MIGEQEGLAPIRDKDPGAVGEAQLHRFAPRCATRQSLAPAQRSRFDLPQRPGGSGRRLRPGADEAGHEDAVVAGERVGAQAVGKGLDADFGGGGDAKLFHRRHQARQRLSGEPIDDRVRTRLDAAGAGEFGGQAGGAEGLVELAAHVGLDADTPIGLDHPVDALGEQRQLGQGADLVDIHLDEGERATGFGERRHPLQRADGVGHVQQDEAADDGIEFPVEVDGENVGLVEAKPAHLRFLGAGAGHRERSSGAIDAEDGAGRADEIGGDHRVVAGAAADVEDRHAGSDAGAAQDFARLGAEKLSLSLEALQLLLGMTEDISFGCFRFHCVPRYNHRLLQAAPGAFLLCPCPEGKSISAVNFRRNCRSCSTTMHCGLPQESP